MIASSVTWMVISPTMIRVLGPGSIAIAEADGDATGEAARSAPGVPSGADRDEYVPVAATRHVATRSTAAVRQTREVAPAPASSGRFITESDIVSPPACPWHRHWHQPRPRPRARPRPGRRYRAPFRRLPAPGRSGRAATRHRSGC